EEVGAVDVRAGDDAGGCRPRAGADRTGSGSEFRWRRRRYLTDARVRRRAHSLRAPRPPRFREVL
ncbi:MAG: hypothetical protein AVDCRST_MAG28-778, partial [uncultured Rubrobacteraceae bacterium]